MNRQTKRMLQRQGQLGPDGTPVASRREATRRQAADPQRQGIGMRMAQYFREVRQELAKVLWPKRSEVINYSTVVLTTLVLIALLIFGLNYLFARGVLFLYKS